VPCRAGEQQLGKRFELAGIAVMAAAFRSQSRGRRTGSPHLCPAEPALRRLAAVGYERATAGAQGPLLCLANPPLPRVTGTRWRDSRA
jgi:hypothetical protein